MATAYLALGSNIGNREANLRMALRGLTRMCRVDAVSSLYASEPVGPQQQPPFYNAVCRVETGLQPLALLRFLQGLEHEIGRRPGGRHWGPRPIDLDILLYEDATVEMEGLSIPHPRMLERSFILAPLAEIAGELRHPFVGEAISRLAEKVGEAGLRRIAEIGWDGAAGSQERLRI